MTLTEQEKQQLIEKVKAIEARTGAEIVTTLATKCDDYPEIPWKAFALGASVAALVIVLAASFLGSWSLWSPVFIAVLILASALLPALLAIIWPLFARLFLSRSRAQAEVRQYAESLFLQQALFETQGRNAVLILVSVFEHAVVIISDPAIHKRISPESFGRLIKPMTDLLARGRIFQAFETGINGLEDILQAHGFTGGQVKNQLPEHLPESRKP